MSEEDYIGSSLRGDAIPDRRILGLEICSLIHLLGVFCHHQLQLNLPSVENYGPSRSTIPSTMEVGHQHDGVLLDRAVGYRTAMSPSNVRLSGRLAGESCPSWAFNLDRVNNYGSCVGHDLAITPL
jgi:hypothetical protein